MTTIAAGRLTDTLQALVDARLDTIDRMLLGRVNRHDRLAIVREVETQIFDLIQARETDSLDRDDILAILARLDPPEAYLPDEETGALTRPMRSTLAGPTFRAPQTVPSRLPMVSGVLGIIAVIVDMILTLILFYALSSGGISNSNIVPVYFGALAIGFLLGLLALILASCARLRGGWAIVGFVLGILSTLTSIGLGLTS